MVGKGAPLGKPQAGGGPRAVAADGRKSIPAVTRLEPEDHRKAHRAAAAAGLSLSGYLAELVRRDVLDENDCPRWAQQESRSEPLPALDLPSGSAA